MPIRTNRGRAAVYRRLWGWPLRSPRHLIATLIGVAILAIAVAVLTSRAGTPNRNQGTAAPFDSISTAQGYPSTSPGSSAPGSSAGGPSTTVPPSITATRLSAPPQAPSPATPSAQAVGVVTSWAQRWVNHPVGMTNQQWLDQLRPYTTAEFLPVMSSISVDNIAATQVTGAPVVSKSFTGSVEAIVPTNAGKLDITAIDTPQGWLVATYTEAQ